MILQPLVENSIRHGIAKRAQAGRIQVHTRRDQDRLSLQIVDNGAGFAEREPDTIVDGIGLQNTKQRLLQL